MSYVRSCHVNLGSEADWRNPKPGRWSQMRNANYGYFVGIRAADKFRVYQEQTKVGFSIALALPRLDLPTKHLTRDRSLKERKDQW